MLPQLLNGTLILSLAFDSFEADEADDEQLEDRDEFIIELIDGIFLRDAFLTTVGVGAWCAFTPALVELLLFSDASELCLDSGGPGLADVDPPDDFLACLLARL